MTLTEKEKFIQHYITISTIRILSRKMGIKTKEMLRDELDSDVDLIRQTRCRKLTDEEISEIFEDMQEEALLGGGVLNDFLD
jgi:hypothetical protein